MPYETQLPSTHAAWKTGYRCTVVDSDATRAAANVLLKTVYQQRLGLSSIQEEHCADSEDLVLLVLAGADPVATLTLQSSAFEQVSGESPGAAFELEGNYDLSPLALGRSQLLEVRRMAVAPGHPGAVQCLCAEAVRLSLRYGVTHWLGLVDTQGELTTDAAIVQRVLDAHGVALRPLPLQPRPHARLFRQDVPEGRSAFSLDCLQRMPLPRRVRAFSHLLNARAVGHPTLHPRYPRVVVPMLARVAAFGGRWLPAASFTRHPAAGAQL